MSKGEGGGSVPLFNSELAQPAQESRIARRVLLVLMPQCTVAASCRYCSARQLDEMRPGGPRKSLVPGTWKFPKLRISAKIFHRQLNPPPQNPDMNSDRSLLKAPPRPINTDSVSIDQL